MGSGFSRNIPDSRPSIILSHFQYIRIGTCASPTRRVVAARRGKVVQNAVGRRGRKIRSERVRMVPERSGSEWVRLYRNQRFVLNKGGMIAIMIVEGNRNFVKKSLFNSVCDFMSHKVWLEQFLIKAIFADKVPVWLYYDVYLKWHMPICWIKCHFESKYMPFWNVIERDFRKKFKAQKI